MSDEEFDRLLDKSSLGSPGAKALRARTSDEEVARAMLIALTEVAAELDDDEALPPLLDRNDEERPPSSSAGGPPFAH